MKVFAMKGVITSMPVDLEALDGQAEVAYAEHLMGRWPATFKADHVRQFYNQVIDRHREGKFNASEVACILTEQQGAPHGFMLKKVHDGYMKGWLKFFYPDGSPYDDYIEGKSDPLHRPLNSMYTMPGDINAWLERWGANYRFPVPSSSKKAPGKMTQQETAIINWLINQGHDPKALPRTGPKAEARKALTADPVSRALFDAETSFNDTWKRLRRDGDIIDMGGDK